MKKIAIVDPASYTLPYDYYYIIGLEDQFDIDFFASKKENLDYYLEHFKKLKNLNLITYQISIPNKIIGLINYLRLLFRLAHTKDDYEYIHFQWSIFWPLELIFFYLFKEKLYFTFHNPVPHDHKKNTFYPYKLISKLAHRVIFVSEYSRNQFISHYLPGNVPKFKMIPHPLMPISPSFEQKVKASSPLEKTFVFWGLIKDYKGVGFFEILAEHRLFQDFKFEVYGKWDPALHDLKMRLSKLENVYLNDKFLTEKELYELIQRNCIFLLPYKSASQSGVVYTLKYYEKVFFSTRVGDQSMLEDRYLFSKDDVSGLRKKIDKLLLNHF